MCQETDTPALQDDSCPACCKTTHRDDAQKKSMCNRLSRMEGQLRGIRGMVEKDAYCVDVLTQVAAVRAALDSFSKVLLDSHIHSCVVRDIRDGKTETTDELLDILHKLMR